MSFYESEHDIESWRQHQAEQAMMDQCLIDADPLDATRVEAWAEEKRFWQAYESLSETQWQVRRCDQGNLTLRELQQNLNA